MNWNSQSPQSWKIGTLRKLTRRALMISSPKDLEKELDHLQNVFCDIKQYPPPVTNKIIAEEVHKHESMEIEHSPIEEPEETEKVQLILPYGGDKDQQLMKKLGRSIENSLKGRVKLRTTCTHCKLVSRFPVKDKTKLIHQHNVSYYIECANKKCNLDYVGQTLLELRTATVKILSHTSSSIRKRQSTVEYFYLTLESLEGDTEQTSEE